MSKLAVGHMTNCMDEVPTVKVFKPVLIRVMSVGMTVEIHHRRIFNTVLITSILRNNSVHVIEDPIWTYLVLLLVEHERRNSPTGISATTSLTPNMDSGMTPAVLILGSGDGASGHQHGEIDDEEVGVTEVVDGE